MSTEANGQKPRKGVTQEERDARKEAKAKVQAQKNETQKALNPLREHVLALVQEYERATSFEHARRMAGVLQSATKAAEIACEEADKDLHQISKGLRPCQPSVLRQRLGDLLSGF